jgi:ribosomal protein S18 acetylase RimI-like enzyme
MPHLEFFAGFQAAGFLVCALFFLRFWNRTRDSLFMAFALAFALLSAQQVLTTFLGEISGQPVGFACLRLIPHLQGDAPYAELTDIYVDEGFRRHGVARALIAQLEATARAAGADEMVIITGFDNARAQAAYRANGYADWALAMQKQFSTE